MTGMPEPSGSPSTHGASATPGVGASRYEPLLKIASGGTATVWVGAAAGALGFRQLVAIKRPHEHLADDPAFIAALMEEAKIASRLRHANVVDVRDVEIVAKGVQLVMDWVEGASMSELIRAWQKNPPARPHAVAIRIVLDACEGLRALHDLKSEDGAPLGCVHRDVSPANILVGLDGVARITDFGLARPLLAVERSTTQGSLRGKLGYMAPEYIGGKEIDRRVDVFAMGIVLWEALARKRLFRGENDADSLERVQRHHAGKLAELPSAGDSRAALVEIDALLERALAKDPSARLPSIDALSSELERIARAHDLLASHHEVRDAFGPALRQSLEERRHEVERALRAVETPVSRREEEVTSPDAPQSLRAAAAKEQPAATPARSRAVALGAAFAGAVVVLAAGALALRDRDASSLASPTPHVIEPDVQSRADEPRSRALEVTAATSSSASGATHATSHGASRGEPGNKPPRPNPYAVGKRP